VVKLQILDHMHQHERVTKNVKVIELEHHSKIVPNRWRLIM